MKYEVRLTFDHLQAGTAIIEADSIEAAQEAAEELDAGDIDDWEGIDGVVHVVSVEPIEKQTPATNHDASVPQQNSGRARR